MIRIALLVMAVFASGYIAFAFVVMEPNPAHWGLAVRLFFVVLCTTIAALGAFGGLGGVNHD